MAQRTTLLKVETALGDNFDGVAQLQQWIDRATLTVDRVDSQATAKGIPLSDALLAEVECLLAAHYYTKYDPVYASKSAGGASGSYAQDSKEPERYKALAINLDYSGALVAILNRQTGRGFSLTRCPPTPPTCCG